MIVYRILIKSKLFLLLVFLCSFVVVTSHGDEVSRIEREAELIDFQSIRDVLKSDNLEEEVEKRVEEVQEVRQERVDRTRNLYNIPSEEDFWPFFSEYWLVSNQTVLKWDFRKPDYGIEESFKKFLEDLGHYEVEFRILLLDSPNITHAYLPAGPNRYLFLLSVPFIRSMDLTRLEISTLLYENFIRAKSRFFEQKVSSEKLQALFGGNFHGEKINMEIFSQLKRNYDKVLFEDGYTFQEQFQVTKQLDNTFKGRENIWNAYYSLLGKIDNLIKTNFLYTHYSQIYPSPELQKGWIRPKRAREF